MITLLLTLGSPSVSAFHWIFRGVVKVRRVSLRLLRGDGNLEKVPVSPFAGGSTERPISALRVSPNLRCSSAASSKIGRAAVRKRFPLSRGGAPRDAPRLLINLIPAVLNGPGPVRRGGGGRGVGDTRWREPTALVSPAQHYRNPGAIARARGPGPRSPRKS